MADRLRASAPANAVLVTESTHRATAAAIDYVARGPLSAPGRSERIGVWQAVAPTSPIRADRAPAQNVALVGRDGELDLIGERLRETRCGASRSGRDGRRRARNREDAPAPRGGARRRRASAGCRGDRSPTATGSRTTSLAEIVKTVAGILDTDAPTRRRRKTPARGPRGGPGGSGLRRGAAPGAARSRVARRLVRACRSLRRLAPLRRRAGRGAPARARARGRPLGRRRPARLRRAAPRHSDSHAVARNLHRAAGAARASARLGAGTSSCPRSPRTTPAPS